MDTFENTEEQYNQHDEDDEDEEPITAKKVLETLKNTWLNERFAPEILPHQTDMLDLMLGQIVHIEENIKQLNKNDFLLIAHKMELERIKYVLSSYLRCRLCKIEKFAYDILEKENEATNVDDKRLSKEEHQFLVTYVETLRSHFNQIVLKHMPLNLQEQSAKEIVRPNLMKHVFLKANVTVPSVIIGQSDEEVDLVAGSRHIMPYYLATELITDGRVQLI